MKKKSNNKNLIIYISQILFAVFNIFPSQPNISSDNLIDVAIIGAGVSGTYAGWRIMNSDIEKNKIIKEISQKNNKPKVMLFEMSNRIGGRLWSVEVVPGLIAELGGMRFLDNQLFVKSLANHLKLPIKPFPSNISNGFSYLRGKRIFKQDYKSKSFKLPYNLTKNEQGKSGADLLEETLRNLIPSSEKLKFGNLKNLTEFWKKDVVFDEPIYNWAMWNLLAKKLSFEAIEFIRDSAGYDDFYENINAGAAIALIASTGGLGKTVPVYHTLVKGYDSLPKTLAEKFVQQGGKLLLNHQLITVNCTSHDSKTLMQILVHDLKNNIKRIYYAKKLILAMPRKSIELLDQECFIFKNKQFMKNLASVGRVTAAKLFLLYDRPWWNQFGFDSGRTTTDLPIRQTYYIKPLEKAVDLHNNHSLNQTNKFGIENKKQEQRQYSLLMASYSDGESSDYWKSYLPSAAYEDESSELINYCQPHQILKCLTIPNIMKQEIQRQLRLMHGIDIPEPIKAIFHSWKRTPFGGGLHHWNPHTKPWQVIKEMRQPIESIPLYIMGDSFSVTQNWVEGALISSEKVLGEAFGLSIPSWLDSNYDMGP